MTAMPAFKIPMFLAVTFITVIVVAVAGAWYYKQTSAVTMPVEGTDSSTLYTTPDATERQPALLRLVPTNTELTSYRIVISNVTQPLTGVAFRLLSSPGGSQLTSNSVETDPNLEDSGWSTEINSSTEADTSQELSFSMLVSSPENSELLESVEIGTITFDTPPTAEELSINTETSYLVYTDSSVSPLNLVIETATMDN